MSCLAIYLPLLPSRPSRPGVGLKGLIPLLPYPERPFGRAAHLFSHPRSTPPGVGIAVLSASYRLTRKWAEAFYLCPQLYARLKDIPNY